MAGKIDYYGVAKRLARLPGDTEPSNWPEADKFLYELGLPEVWSVICISAHLMTKNAVLKIWLLIEFINGWRRQAGKWNIEFALYMLDKIKRGIDQLPPDHPRKDRLIEMFLYHLGLVYHAAGKFFEAAECHEKAAQGARNEWGRLLSLFCAAWERLNAAICGKGEIASCYTEFTKACENFLAILAGDDDKNIRWRANIYCYLTFYAWVVERKYPAEETIAFLDELPKLLKPAFINATVALEALCEFPASRKRAVEITNRINPGAEIDFFILAKLVKISTLKKMEKSEEALAARKELDGFFEDRHGGHIAWAILAHMNL